MEETINPKTAEEVKFLSHDLEVIKQYTPEVHLFQMIKHIDVIINKREQEIREASASFSVELSFTRNADIQTIIQMSLGVIESKFEELPSFSSPCLDQEG